MTMFRAGPAAVAATMIAAVAVPPPALALSTDAGQSADAGRPATFSQRQLLNYAAAVVRISALRRAVESRLEAAPQGERRIVQAQLNAEISEAVTRLGLSPSRFDMMSRAIARDPAMRRTVRQLVMEKAVGF